MMQLNDFLSEFFCILRYLMRLDILPILVNSARIHKVTQLKKKFFAKYRKQLQHENILNLDRIGNNSQK